MKRSFHRNRLLGLAAIAAAWLVAAPANAASIGAHAGRAVSASQQSCFTMNFGKMTNACGVPVLFDVPLLVNSAGSHGAQFTASGSGPANNIGCQAVGNDAAGTVYWASPRVYLSSFGSAQTVVLNGAYVPGGGYLYASCYFYPQATLSSVNWNF